MQDKYDCLAEKGSKMGDGRVTEEKKNRFAVKRQLRFIEWF